MIWLIWSIISAGGRAVFELASFDFIDEISCIISFIISGASPDVLPLEEVMSFDFIDAISCISWFIISGGAPDGLASI